jgi:hypothetical protein
MKVFGTKTHRTSGRSKFGIGYQPVSLADMSISLAKTCAPCRNRKISKSQPTRSPMTQQSAIRSSLLAGNVRSEL